MRRLLLLVAVCLVGVLVMSPAAFADMHTASAMGSASASAMGSASASAMGSASASASAMGSASASASATATASASALPGTGGPIGPSLLGLMAGAMLLGSGVVSLAIVRRRI
jgi:hypothetical protein